MPKVFYLCPLCLRGFTTRVKTDNRLRPIVSDVGCGCTDPPTSMEYCGTAMSGGADSMRDRRRQIKADRRQVKSLD